MPLHCETLTATLSQGRGKGNRRVLRGMWEELVEEERGRLLHILAQTCKGLKIPKALQPTGFRERRWKHSSVWSLGRSTLMRLPSTCAAWGNSWCWITLGLAAHEDNSPDCTWGEINHSCEGCFSQLSTKTAEGNSCRPQCPTQMPTVEQESPSYNIC